MRQFDYDKILPTLMTPEIMNAISSIHEYRGKQDLYLVSEPAIMDQLCEVARVQSTKASNSIENIATSDRRLRELMAEKVEPANRDEREIAGYRYVLDLIHGSHPHIGVTPNVILQLHRDLYRYSDAGFAGQWKDSDNVISELAESGEWVTRFAPMSAAGTPHAVAELCAAYAAALSARRYDPLLVDALFTFDFVSIHPFTDGNGRLSRLLTLLLLYKGGYQVGKYISLELEIERTKQTYYDALKASSAGWIEGQSDYAPFVTYLLGVIGASYRTLHERVRSMSSPLSSDERVRQFLDNSITPKTKQEIMDANPDLSQKTVERAVQKLQSEGIVEKVGAARSTAYRTTRD